MGVIKNYYRLTKPGIVYGNVLHGLAAALLAWSLIRGPWWEIAWVSVGLALIVASACVINCIMDRHLDAKMERTKKRPLPMHQISVRNAVIYSIVLLAVGAGVLWCFTNIVALIAALIGHVTYTAVYGYAKRHSWTGTMVGTIPGAMPILAGYAAVDPTLPATAWILWVVVLLWQLPHFYALSLYRKDDYAKSGLPMMSVVKPRKMVMQHITWTAILYVLPLIVLIYVSPLSMAATLPMSVAALLWVYVILFAKERGSDPWARKVFGTSLYLPMVMVLSGVIAVALS